MIWNISGYDVLLDDEDYERLKEFRYSVGKYTLDRQGRFYFRRNLYVDSKRTTISLHRDIMGCVYGDGETVDHKDGNTLDCRKENLRFSTHAENMRNCKIYTNNTSGIKGVQWHTRIGKWTAQIRVDGVLKHLGYHADIKDAEAAYTKASKEFHGEFRRVT